MRIHKFGHTFLALLIATASVPLVSSFAPYNGGTQVVAQTVDARKKEADRLLEQGIEQFQTSQFTAAKESCEQALLIYREIKDRKGETLSLGSLGVAYALLGDYPKAI
jgi:Flp pilus assembly protein TadD